MIYILVNFNELNFNELKFNVVVYGYGYCTICGALGLEEKSNQCPIE